MTDLIFLIVLLAVVSVVGFIGFHLVMAFGALILNVIDLSN